MPSGEETRTKWQRVPQGPVFTQCPKSIDPSPIFVNFVKERRFFDAETGQMQGE
jgi:hypothetical protein